MKRKTHRCNYFIVDVNFKKLDEAIKKKGISKADISRKCGYRDDYITRHVFREKKLNTEVASILKNVYGISPEEYVDEESHDNMTNVEIIERPNEDDIYTLGFSCNGEFLKRLACASMNKHMSIEDFIYKCLDIILDNEGRKD